MDLYLKDILSYSDDEQDDIQSLQSDNEDDDQPQNYYP